MDELHAVTLAIGYDSLAKILGYDSQYRFPHGVVFLPVRVDGPRACFDFISDAPFKIGEIDSLIVQPGCPLPWAKFPKTDGGS